jgi:hypothetical protein
MSRYSLPLAEPIHIEDGRTLVTLGDAAGLPRCNVSEGSAAEEVAVPRKYRGHVCADRRPSADWHIHRDAAGGVGVSAVPLHRDYAAAEEATDGLRTQAAQGENAVSESNKARSDLFRAAFMLC